MATTVDAGLDLRDVPAPTRAVLSIHIAQHARRVPGSRLAPLSPRFLMDEFVRMDDFDGLCLDDRDALTNMIAAIAPALAKDWRRLDAELERRPW